MAKNMCVSSTWTSFSCRIRFRGVRALKMDIEDFGADWCRCKSGTYSSQIRQRDTIFGEIIQYFIKFTLSKNNTSFLSLIMFHEKRAEISNKAFRIFMLCHLYHNQNLCLYWLSSLSIEKIGKMWVLNMETKVLTEYWVLEFQIF